MRRVGSLAGMIGLLAAVASPAATIRVPEDSPSVLAAADLAMPGDTVLVGPGTWTDRATRVIVAQNGTFVITACAFPRGGVVIRGQGAGVTVLDVEGAGSYPVVIEFAERSGEGVLRVEAMTITGARGGQAVAGIFSDGLEIVSCRLEGNTHPSSGAAVIAMMCPLRMVDCDVVNNISPGVIDVSHTTLEVVGCRFEGNSGRCIQTDTYPTSYSAVLRDCAFVRNRGRGSGVAANLQYASNYLIEGCLFLENVAQIDQAGAAVRVSGGSGEIRYNVFAYDSCYAVSSTGAGVVLERSVSVVTQNTFVGCHTTLDGAAFAAIYTGSAGEFTRNVVVHTTGGSAVLFAEGTSMVGGCNLFWMNQYGNFGGGGDMSPTDFIADPLFCDLEHLDFTVRNDSPCISPPTPSCAPIGALGVGCGMVAVEAETWGRIKALFR